MGRRRRELERAEHPPPTAGGRWDRQRWQAQLNLQRLPVNLLQRWVTVKGKGEFSLSELMNIFMDGRPARDEEIEEALKRHSPAFIIGTSLGFEVIVLAFAAWSFCRRDF